MELEDLLVQEGVAAPPGQIREVLDGAMRDGAHPVVALIEAGIVSEDVLAEVLARAAETIVVDLDVVDMDPPPWLTADLARQHWVLALSAPKGGHVRVAFVDPLDEEARAIVESASGASVQVVVGSLTPMRRAIDHIYRERTQRHASLASEMPAENTRKVEGPDPATGTTPLRHLEDDATVEQRHQALLLALIERGLITRADYAEALKRLLGKRE